MSKHLQTISTDQTNPLFVGISQQPLNETEIIAYKLLGDFQYFFCIFAFDVLVKIKTHRRWK